MAWTDRFPRLDFVSQLKNLLNSKKFSILDSKVSYEEKLSETSLINGKLSMLSKINWKLRFKLILLSKPLV